MRFFGKIKNIINATELKMALIVEVYLKCLQTHFSLAPSSLVAGPKYY